jgi:CRP/FNR family transcriptional regulator, cyclic AMP receptor protein
MVELENKIYTDIEYLGHADRFLDEILEGIESVQLFEGFERDELNVLCHFMPCYAAPRDYILFEEGCKSDFLIIVLTGHVDVIKMIPGQDIKKIRDVGPGASLGELSLVDKRPRYATCITTVPTDFAVLRRDVLDEVLVHYPRLANKLLLVLLHTITMRMRETSDRFIPNVYSSVP